MMPTLIAIEPDDYYAEHVGRTADGRQFFLTTPFEPAMAGEAACGYVALYLFDASGRFLQSTIESLGPRAAIEKDAGAAVCDMMLDSLGDFSICRIEVEPFSIEKDGVEFGLISRELEDEEDIPAVEAQPGNYMAFFEPWDSGEYDT